MFDFLEKTDKIFGETIGSSPLFKKVYSSPIGNLSLVANECGLVGIWFEGQAYFENGVDKTPLLTTTPILDLTCDLLEQYFAGQQPDVSNLPLSIQGTVFQKKVWQELTKIPSGQTITYKELAEKLNCKSAQAVGGAVGKNPMAILVPCHRVLGSNGSLTGYAGGLDKKSWLLKHERVIMIEEKERQ